MPDIRRTVIYHGCLVCKPCEVLVIQSEMFLGEAADYRNQKVLMLLAELGAKMPLQRVKQPFLVAPYQAVGLLPGIRQFLDQIASQISGCPCDQRRAFFYRNARNCRQVSGESWHIHAI